MGWGNLGDAAVQEAFITSIRRRLPNVELVAFSLNPEDTALRHGLQSHPIIWSYPRGAQSNSGRASAPRQSKLKVLLKRWRAVYAIAKPIHDIFQECRHVIRSFGLIKPLDLLIVSGGGQLSELWRGPWSHPYNIFKFSVLARLAKTPVLIVGVGAGPLEHPLSRFFVRWSVRLARYTSLRDHESQILLRKSGVRTKTEVFPDPAYALPIADYIGQAGIRSTHPKIGINPIGFSDPRVWAREDIQMYQRYLTELEHFCRGVLARGYDIEIFTAEISVDRYAIQELQERLANSGGCGDGGTVACITRLDLKGLLTQMSTFDFVITSKFHGVIFSHLLGKPVVALSYHRKIDDLMRKVGHEDYCLPISGFTAESLKAQLELLIRNQETLRTLFDQTARESDEAVKSQFDRLFAAAADEKTVPQLAMDERKLAGAEGYRP